MWVRLSSCWLYLGIVEWFGFDEGSAVHRILFFSVTLLMIPCHNTHDTPGSLKHSCMRLIVKVL